ncbi:MAG: helix-hairpin-helix domain-containing protein [Anaerovibrio sp.]
MIGMPMFKRSMAVLLVIMAVAAGVTMWEMYDGDEVQLLADNRLSAGDEQAGKNACDTRQVAVYVTGEVQQPGVVYVAFDGRVADAVNGCGGVLSTADMGKVNMAQPVKDGMHIRVPEKLAAYSGNGAMQGETAAGKTSGSKAAGGSKGASGSDGTMVNINTASADELTKLKGIGPAMAQRIVEYREENGMFQSPEDLQKVRGIGKAKFAKLKEQITL